MMIAVHSPEIADSTDGKSLSLQRLEKGVARDRPTTLWLRKGPFLLGFGRGGGDRTRPPNYKVPWNEGVATAHEIQLLILLTKSLQLSALKRRDETCL
jgi:hypothetical protein